MKRALLRHNGSRRDYLKNLLANRKNYRQTIQSLVKGYKYVVFYGCGRIFPSIVETWNRNIDREIDFCCDSACEKWGKFFCGIECISPVKLSKIKEQCLVFVTVGDSIPVFDYLKTLGITSVHQLYRYNISSVDYLAAVSPEELIGNLERVYGYLSDARSKEVLDAVITRFLDYNIDIDIMQKIGEKNQYFPGDIIKLSEHERFVDVGAFDGDTVIDFIKRTNGKFDQIYALELDTINFNALKNNVERLEQHDRIKIFNFGAWNCAKNVYYNIGESVSTIGNGDVSGRVDKLDKILSGKSITFIKMDIEGAEPQALAGAKRLIHNCKPTLAICVYHDFRHLWEIPSYIKYLVPEYKIYLRHHTSAEYETVCYAML